MEPLIATIILFAGNFAPRGYSYCDGQLLPISQNSALFSLLGTTYGGDGRTTFGLPDCRGRVVLGPRRGAGLSDYRLGQRGGAETVILNQTQIPSHTHAAVGTVKCNFSPGTPATTGNPLNGNFANSTSQTYNTSVSDKNMAADNVGVTVGNTGGSLAHTNMQPYIAMNYIIAMTGIFPSRN